MRFSCTTQFDITATGVTGHYKSSRVPFQDRAGNTIGDIADWNRSRNQQRNWETVQQIISMRTQIVDSTQPCRIALGWFFEFEIETPGAYGPESSPVSILYSDADGVPMIADLGNCQALPAFLIVSGTQQNIWFAPIAINN